MAKIIHEYIQNTQDLPFKIFEFHAHNLKRIVPMHWHQSTEILYCAKGNLAVKVKDSKFLLKEKDFIVINTYEIHSTQSPTENWILCIQIPFSFISLLTSNHFYKEYLFDANSCQKNFKKNTMLTDYLDQILMLDNHANNNFIDNLKLISLVVNILTVLFDKYSIHTSDVHYMKNISFIEQATNYLSEHYSQDIQLHDIAKYFSYSDSYTSRLIKSSLSTTFSEMLKIIRINKAVDLINTTDLRLNEIAEQTGFKNYRNLYNAFYQSYQMSPKEFKINHQ
jgi:AraC-like DNA-binding protein